MNILEQLIVENLGNWGLLLIPFVAGIFVSFFAEVFNKVSSPKYHSNFWILIISTITCALLVGVFPYYYAKIDTFSILMLLFNVAVSFLFYPIVGKKLVGKIFAKFEEKANDAIDKV